MNEDRRRVVRLVCHTNRGLAVALAIDAVLLAALPKLVLVALGIAVGRVPAAVGAGLDSPDGRRLAEAMAWVVIALAGALLVGPAHATLARIARARISGTLQSRLMRAASAPAGIAHLDDSATAEQVSLARGALMTWDPADAPAALVLVWSKRLGDAFAYVVLSWYVWWLGPLLCAVWVTTRRPILRVIQEHIGALGGQADVMRRAEYLRRLTIERAAAKELRVFGVSRWLVDRFRATWDAGMAQVWAIRGGVDRVIWGVGIVLLVTYVGSTAYVAWLGWGGGLDVGEVAVVVTMLASTRATGAIDFDDIALEWMLSAFPHLDEVERRLASPPDGSASRPGGDPAPRPEAAIRFEGVEFAYPTAPGRPVLAGLDLSLEAGASTAIVGANGAGKTTLIKLLTRLYDPTGGRITVDGRDLGGMAAADWRAHVAVLMQDFLRLPLSAADNIRLGAGRRTAGVVSGDAGVEEAARLAGALTTIEGLPRGWETVLSPRFTGGADLSAGEWQRVALARCMFAARHGASVLVLDEPTAWMDVRAESEFFERFLDLTRGLTTVLISHRFATVRLADHIVVLADGRVAEQGSHEALLDLDGSYARMFRLQAARFTAAGADVDA